MYGDHRDLHVLTHSFPTRRSSDLSTRLPSTVPTSADRAGARRGSEASSARTTSTPRSAPRLTFAISSAATAGSSRSEEHTSELQSLMRISYAVFCLKKKKDNSIHRVSVTQSTQRTHINALQ